jgi:hypothetical protein
MNLSPSIHYLRTTTGASDTAILDYLHLLELHDLPVQPRVSYLQVLWQCSQSQVSRRMTAIGELGCCRVVNCWGRYQVSAEAPLPKHERISRRLQVNRQRWAELQKQWREAQP